MIKYELCYHYEKPMTNDTSKDTSTTCDIAVHVCQFFVSLYQTLVQVFKNRVWWMFHTEIFHFRKGKVYKVSILLMDKNLPQRVYLHAVFYLFQESKNILTITYI